MSSNSNLPDLEIHEVGFPLKRGGSAEADLAMKRHTKQRKQEEQISIPSLTAASQVSNNNNTKIQPQPEVIEKKKKVLEDTLQSKR